MAELITKYYLVGFMGAGKTTVGYYLAKILACQFVDLDQLIVEKEGRSISEIFATEGEPYFRALETDILKNLPKDEVAVYSTGGGIVVLDVNREYMRRAGKIIYLRAQWNTLQERLKSSKGRPLIDAETSWSKILKLWKDRQPYYHTADMIVDTDGFSPEQVAEKILSALNREKWR